MNKRNATKNADTLQASGTEQFIPLNRLKNPATPARCRTPGGAIDALAASIAAHGLLQSPVVEPERDDDGRPTGKFLVTIGEGRRLALLLRAKRKEIAKTEPIRCTLAKGAADFFKCLKIDALSQMFANFTVAVAHGAIGLHMPSQSFAKGVGGQLLLTCVRDRYRRRGSFSAARLGLEPGQLAGATASAKVPQAPPI
ncbi:ParB/Srx family N-terminal domain-containing protein [Bradyrhizobium sp. SZCCHNRI1001]|uniref:ParB/Srx family N-terminal domain-containing protein n=1 Tax=unclassified Bradyrhizobium TaxID=2631580 RepID=UPI00396567FF